MAAHYIALIHKDADSGYGVSFPDVLGVTTVADAQDAAIHEAGVALAFAFEEWAGEVPAPRTLDQLRADPEFLSGSRNAVVSAIAPADDLAHAA